MDESVDKGGDLALDDEVARRLEVGDDLAQAGAELERLFIDSCYDICTDLLDEVHDLLLRGVAGYELVDVCHDVHTDVASQVIPGLREGGGAEDEEGEAEECLKMKTVEVYNEVTK